MDMFVVGPPLPNFKVWWWGGGEGGVQQNIDQFWSNHTNA